MLNEQEKIDKYLNDEMTSSEKIAFEKAMDTNEELVDSIAINKDLFQFFTERNPELEQSLSNLGSEYFQEEGSPQSTPTQPIPNQVTDTKVVNKSNNIRWILPLLLLAVVSLGSFWFLNKDNSEIMNDPSSVLSPVDAEQMIEKGMLEEGGDEAEMIEIIEEEDPVKKIKTDFDLDETFNSKSGDNKSKTKKPIAKIDNTTFKQNKMLESLILENVRSGAEFVTIDSPSKGYTYRLKGDLINLKFKGSTNSEKPLELVIYDNNPSNFDKDFKILKSTLNKSKSDEDYKLSFNANIELPQGLYYYIIRLQNTENIIHISKFHVKR